MAHRLRENRQLSALAPTGGRQRHRRLRAAACLLGVLLVLPGAGAQTAANEDPTLLLRSEARLLEAVSYLQAGEIDLALRTADALARDVPSFRSAQLLRAQLLAIKAGHPDAHPLPAIDNRLAEQGAARLTALQQEIQRRLQAHLAAPPTDQVPRAFVQIPASVRHAVAIDTSKSRLYLFGNDGQHLRLIADFYISVGQEGVDKRSEGDQRTPLGMYFITRSIPGEKLPDLYGVGALPINYPNDWDRMQGRTGSGIWLHGSPSDEFARLPLASDGCVVLSNPDMEILLQMLDRRTPVLITREIEWAAPDSGPQTSAATAFDAVLQQWQQAWREGDETLLAQLYSEALLASEPLQRRRAAQMRHLQASDFILEEPAIYAWSDTQGQIRIVNLQSRSREFPQGLTLRQYWRLETGNRWVLFSEDVLG
ncbi:L,D-transpeptidase family protein [Lampropedia cohaerens]|uniref:L,D-transpeptidase family protein n=1 Tax=Lampropedia cohaerens TaxID=1610491 RepID=UPI00069931B6|nr:L,D-transpeptidase family protein [Lampropedia cohaerens]